MSEAKTVNVHEGLSRIASVFKALGWLWLAGWLACGIYGAFTETNGLTFLMLMAMLGIVGYAAGTALAWVIQGFAQPR